MKTYRSLMILCLCTFVLFHTSFAQDIIIESVDSNGEVTWTDNYSNGFYAVEWSSSASGPWKSDWNDLKQIAGTGGVLSASVPMFSRLHFKSFEPWAQNWTLIAASGGTNMFQKWVVEDMPPGEYGNHPFYEGAGVRTGILGLHPVSIPEPTKLRFSGTQPLSNSTLRVLAGGNSNGDCLLQCRVNGSLVNEYVLTGTNWTTCDYDISSYTGQTVTLEIWNANGGPGFWFNEHCYIDEILFDP